LASTDLEALISLFSGSKYDEELESDYDPYDNNIDDDLLEIIENFMLYYSDFDDLSSLEELP
jgi:hypothetical protein